MKLRSNNFIRINFWAKLKISSNPNPGASIKEYLIFSILFIKEAIFLIND